MNSRVVRLGDGGLQPASAERRGETYADKLLKYVPAEAIAFFVPAYALVEAESIVAQWSILLVGLVGTLLHLVIRAGREGQVGRVPWYFYGLSVVAFVLWAIGATSVDQLLPGFPAWLDQLAIPIGVFLVPAVDEAFARAR